MITIRLATAADADLIADMSRQTFFDTFSSQNTKENMDKFLGQQFTREVLLKEVGSAWNIFILAYDGLTPVGYARMRENNNPPSLGTLKAMEIARIYAISNAIGKGVGSVLMKECIDMAIGKKNKALWLGVWEHNQRAIAFYTKWGFEKFSDHQFLLGDDLQNDWLMKKML